MTLNQAELQELLHRKAQQAGVVGAVAAVGMSDGPTQVAAWGVLNSRTLEPVRPDSLFEIGSITKVMVATLAMQLVAEGRLSLDRPVRDVVADFRVADAIASSRITLRQLLSHSSGIDGDFFYDPGGGAAAVDRFARACAVLEQLHTPGQGVSYSNAGYVLIGWLIERICGRPFAEVLETWLTTMLGANSIRIEHDGERRPNRVDGHVHEGGRLVAVARHLPPFAHAPAGARTTARIEDVVRFAQLHLRTGSNLLPTELRDEMRRPQVLCPTGDWECGARGLGWELFGEAPHFLLGHDGATPGQAAFLRIVPQTGQVLALFTTGPGARQLFNDLVRALAPEQASLLAQLPPSPTPGVTIAPLAGRYVCRARFIEISVVGDELQFRSGARDDPAGLVKPASARLVPAGPGVMLRYDPGSDQPRPLVFLDFDAAGVPWAAYSGQRLHRRLTDPDNQTRD